MTRVALVNIAHQYLDNALKPGGIAIDATLGNGHDTVFLMKKAGLGGKVYGFDIQAQALAATETKCRQLGLPTECLVLHHASHAQMASLVPIRHHGKINAITFNLGYLPGGDKTIITRPDSTLAALNQASQLLAVGGVMTAMVYPGHAGGDEEAAQVSAWCAKLPTDIFQVQTVLGAGMNISVPRLIVIAKRLAVNG